MADVTTEEDAVEEPEGARQEAADASGGKDDGTDEDTGGYPGGQVGDAADPLAGWDEHGGGVGSVGERPQPRWLPDGTVLALVGLIGAVLGAATTRRRRAGALLGGFAGLLLGMIERRLWEGR